MRLGRLGMLGDYNVPRDLAKSGSSITSSQLIGWRPWSHGRWLFAPTILSRTARSAAASGGLRSLTRSSARTECCPCDQGRFLGLL